VGGSYRKGRREASRAGERITPPLADVFLTMAVRTSDGPSPDHKRLPPGEAAALVARRRAVYGDRPPAEFEDGGVRPGEVARMMPR
jgi:hypothetical protein